MKTFAFDSIERYSRFSETRNLKKLICNKEWRAFTEDEEKESYTFMPNGTVMIMHNSVTLKGSWTLDQKNRMFTIEGKNSKHRFAMIFISKEVMVLNPAGDSCYSFLINENNDKFFKPRFYPDLINYFRSKDAEEDKEASQAAICDTPPADNRSESFKQKVASRHDAIEQKKMQEAAEELREQITDGNNRWGQRVFWGIVIAVYAVTLVYNIIKLPIAQAVLDTITYGTIINVVVALLFINKLVEKLLDIIAIKRWKKANSNDPRSKFI